jgi:exonuclease VII large subunit
MTPPNQPDFDPTSTGTWASRPVPSHSDFQRLEDRLTRQLTRIDERTGERLDRISEALNKMVQLQADVVNQARRLDAHERHAERQDGEIERNRNNISDVKADLSKWVNRGMGAWGVMALAITLWEKFNGG